MSAGQQVRVGEGRVRRPASAKASLEVPTGTAGAARARGRIMVSPGEAGRPSGPVRTRTPAFRIRPLVREEVSPLGDIRLWA